MLSSLERLKESHGVTVQWHAFELRPPGTPPLSQAYKAQILSARPRFKQIAQEQYGITINEGPFGISSRASLMGAKYAESLGLSEPYHDKMLDAYWQQAKSIDQIDVLVEVATSVGINKDDYLNALEDADGTWTNAVLQDVTAAHQMGISGVPAMVFQKKYLVSGAQPYEVLVQAVEQITEMESQSNQAAG